MKVAIFYDAHKYETASALKNIIVSHNCDVVIQNEEEIWSNTTNVMMLSVMQEVTHVLFIYSEPPCKYSGFLFFSGYAAGKNIPILILQNENEMKLPKNHLHLVIVLTAASFDSYFTKEKERFAEIERKEKAKLMLLEKGYSLFISNFITAISNNEIDAVKLFIEAGYNPSERDAFGTPILSLAVRGRFYDMVKLLIENGAEINSCSNDRNYSALMDAAQIGEYEIAKLLLENNANPDIQSKDKQSALILAIGRQDVQITSMLIKHNADKSIQDVLGMTALDYAKLFNNKDILEILSLKD